MSRFQSSPARGGGCNWTPASTHGFARWFQSSPARGGGCKRGHRHALCAHCRVSILTRPWGRVQSWVGCRSRWGCRGFNPHPPVGAGATHFTGLWGRRQLGVSILTRPWGRVQREPSLFRDSGLRVSILTRPWGRVQRAGATHYGLMGGCFNPHPPVRAGATPATMYPLAPVCCFNPHPPVGAGAT